MIKSNKKNYLTIFYIVLIGLSAYLGFGPLFDIFKDGITSQFLAAIFGTVFTIILTMFLLNKQTEIEEEKSGGQSVFTERVELYKSILNQMREIVRDGSISIREMNDLQFMLVQLQMLSEDNTLQKFTKVYTSISEAFSRTDENQNIEASADNNEELLDETIITQNDKIEILKSLLEFSKECRLELGLSSTEKDNNELFKFTERTLEKSQDAVENKKIALSRNEIKSEAKLQIIDYLKENLVKSKRWNLPITSDLLSYFSLGEGKEVAIGYEKDNIRYAFCRINPLPPKKEGDKFKFKINHYQIIFNDFTNYNIETDELGIIAQVNMMKNEYLKLFEEFNFVPEKNFYTFQKSGKNNLKITLSCYLETDLENSLSPNFLVAVNNFLAAYSCMNYNMLFGKLIPLLESKNIKLDYNG